MRTLSSLSFAAAVLLLSKKHAVNAQGDYPFTAGSCLEPGATNLFYWEVQDAESVPDAFSDGEVNFVFNRPQDFVLDPNASIKLRPGGTYPIDVVSEEKSFVNALIRIDGQGELEPGTNAKVAECGPDVHGILASEGTEPKTVMGGTFTVADDAMEDILVDVTVVYEDEETEERTFAYQQYMLGVKIPTTAPTVEPTTTPTTVPTVEPTIAPTTTAPTGIPTATPSTATPTGEPTLAPTMVAAMVVPETPTTSPTAPGEPGVLPPLTGGAAPTTTTDSPVMTTTNNVPPPAPTDDGTTAAPASSREITSAPANDNVPPPAPVEDGTTAAPVSNREITGAPAAADGSTGAPTTVREQVGSQVGSEGLSNTTEPEPGCPVCDDASILGDLEQIFRISRLPFNCRDVAERPNLFDVQFCVENGELIRAACGGCVPIPESSGSEAAGSGPPPSAGWKAMPSLFVLLLTLLSSLSCLFSW